MNQNKTSQNSTFNEFFSFSLPKRSGKNLEKMSDEETKDKAKTSGAEDDEEPGVTMVDVLEDEESLEADAKAVLGNSDEKHCSYHSGGYMKRQALYSCLDCTDASSEGEKKIVKLVSRKK